MSRYRTEEILRALRCGRISEGDAENRLSREYNDGVPYGVHEAVRNCANGWTGNDIESSARKIEDEYRRKEDREQMEKEEQEELRRCQERRDLEQQQIRQQEQEEYDRQEQQEQGNKEVEE